ncbi:MAG: hypothetical protein JO337_01920 [Acidimicrobiales bacterium]|nr:hypothetical protein [Acidimicrobiales bacterium]
MTGDGDEDVDRALLALQERVEALEARLAALDATMETRRLAVVDDQGHERLVAELVDGVAELRFDLPGPPPGRRTSLLLFAVPRQPDWCAGLGVQLWVEGNLVEEMTWWEDQEHRANP